MILSGLHGHSLLFFIRRAKLQSYNILILADIQTYYKTGLHSALQPSLQQFLIASGPAAVILVTTDMLFFRSNSFHYI